MKRISLADMILEDMEVYKIALEISKLAWAIYNELPREHKYTIGSQFLEASDSIRANIAEGFGRFHNKDSLRFYYNSRGSLFETKHWITLLIQRNLADYEKITNILELIEIEQLKFNNFKNSIKTRIKNDQI